MFGYVFSISFLMHSFCSGVIRVTCIGDSITAGSSCCNVTYATMLADMLGPDYEVLNSGVSSKTMLKQGLENDGQPDSYWDTREWKSALLSQPDIVTIMLGTNDAKYINWEGVQQNTGDYYALDYVDMIKTLRGLRPVPKVYVMVPPPLYEPYPFQMNKTIINTIYSTLIRNIAAVSQASIIDVFGAFPQTASSNITCDGCHPTNEGNQIIAETIYAQITGR